MRRAEACAVRWADLDLDSKTLTVSRSHVALPGVRATKETKTRSTRSIRLDDRTVEVLRKLREQRAELAAHPDLYVFTDDGLTPWRPDTASNRWTRVRERAGARSSIRLHDLRHWQATQLLDAGVPLPTVAARLGHASGMTTMKVYAHRTAEADEQAAAIVGDALDEDHG